MSNESDHQHIWGEWIGYDSHVFEMGLSEGFRYRRTCHVNGCYVRQRALNLVPEGKIKEDIFKK